MTTHRGRLSNYVELSSRVTDNESKVKRQPVPRACAEQKDLDASLAEEESAIVFSCNENTGRFLPLIDTEREQAHDS